MTSRRLRVPDSIAIVGYDDIDFAAAAAVSLTSVRQPGHRLRRAARRLHAVPPAQTRAVP